MDDFALTPAERALFAALGQRVTRLDIVLTAHGLESFDVEYARSLERTIDGVSLRILPLERIITSKRAIGRSKDTAQLPALEATLLARDTPPEGTDPSGHGDA